MTRIPDDVRRGLKAAARKCRNLIKEIATRSTAFARPDRRDANALLERIRRRHEALGLIDVSEATLRKLRNDGRP